MRSSPNTLLNLYLRQLSRPPLSQTHLAIRLRVHPYPSNHITAWTPSKRYELLTSDQNKRESARITNSMVRPNNKMAAPASPSRQGWEGEHARETHCPEISTHHQPSNRLLFTHNRSAISLVLPRPHRDFQLSIPQILCLLSWQCKPGSLI
jgi:hypothetical protein